MYIIQLRLQHKELGSSSSDTWSESFPIYDDRKPPLTVRHIPISELSKNGRKNYMEGQREGEKVDTKRADKVCWVLPVYPIIHSLLIILLCAGGIQPQRSPVLWLLVRISLGEIWREGEYKEGGKWSQSISLQPDHLWLPESSAEGCGSSQAALSTVPQCWVPVECPS